MRFMQVTRKFGFVALAGMVAAASGGCAADGDLSEYTDEADPDEIVGANAVGRNLTVASYVLVAPTATDAQILDAVKREVRPLLGSMHAIQVGTNDRDAANVDPTTFQRDTVTVVDPANPSAPTTTMLRVRFSYTDRVTVPKTVLTDSYGRLSRSTLETTLLMSNWAASGTSLTDPCTSEDGDWGASYLYFSFDPTTTRCRDMIRTEDQAILAERRGLADNQITVRERDRVFLPRTARLTSITDRRVRYPEYHRLFTGSTFDVYSFFGADDVASAHDIGAENFFLYMRTLTTTFPTMRLAAHDGSNLASVTWNGHAIANVTPTRVFTWIIDGRDYPTEVATADRDRFRSQVIAQWRDRYIDLTMPMNASIQYRTSTPNTHALAVTVHVYYAERPSTSVYEEAWQNGNVVQYTGHTYIGSGGPIDARNYTASDFPDRYQIFMANSCVSFSYYNNNFADLHPGGTRNLDTITNGLSVYLKNSGLSSARLITGLLDGRMQSYASLLSNMRIDLPWARSYDANRVADGETDNVFTTANYTVGVTPVR